MDKLQVAANHYNINYDNQGRFISYWHQINEVLKLKPKTVLEIGIGTSLVSDYLKKQGICVVTVDINLKLRPNIAASILNLPIKGNSFDIVICFQVLEHIPFEYFSPAIGELQRITKKYVLISLPNRKRHFYLCIKIYPGIQKELKFTLPYLSLPRHIFDGEHYWEIGKKGFPLQKVNEIIKQNALQLRRDYRVPEKPLHHIFVLEKNEKFKSG